MNSKNLTIPLFFSMLTFAACGGGGGGGGANAPIPSASLSSLTADRLTAPADGASEVLLTAVVRDTVGGALAGRQVQFQTIGAGAVLDPANAVSLSGGIATAKLRSNVAGTITVNAVVSPAADAVRLDTTLTITFVAPNAPVVAGPARFEDRDGDGVAGAGDRVVVPFSTSVAVNGAVAADFVLPIQDDSFGAGATVAAGPEDNEVSITLGAGARLRTRGRFDPTRVTSNEPSGIDVQSGAGIASAADGTPAAASAAADVAAGPVAQIAVPAGGQLVALGDLNSDLLPEVLAASASALTPLVNDGGTFTVATGIGITSPTAIEIANLNRISNAEVVAGDAIGVRIFNSTSAVGGVVSLSEAGFVATGPVNGLVLVDVNTDGFLDIVTATPVGVIVAVHQRNLGNTYAIDQSLFLPSAVQDVVAVDLDNDGDPDVLALQAGGVKVLRNDAGTLVEVDELAVANGARLSTGDVNADHRADVLFSGGGVARLFVQQADGSFVGQLLDVAAQKAELVDLDGDAFDDVVATTTSALEYLQNDRSGGFERVRVEPSPGLADVRVADIDRDGDDDVVAIDDAATRASLGSLQGTFGDATLVESQQLTDTAIGKQALADLNGDGFTDRVVSIANAAQVWFGDGDGNFTVGASFGPSGTISAIALGDMDNDGDVDAVLGYDDGLQPNEIWVNDGSGQFTFSWALAVAVTRSFGLTDFEQDGDLDIFVGNDGDNEVYINTIVAGSPQLIRDNDVFDGLLPQAVGNETIAVLVFDFDREGDDDIILVNGGDLTSPQDAYVLRRSGDGYTLLNTLNAQLLATAATIADVDGDGREDLAIAQLSSNGSASVKWFRGFNTSISTLSTNVATNGQYFSRSLIVADIDGDGRSDFVVGDVSVSNQPIAVLVQQPDGSFQVGQEFPTTRLEQIGAGDFDRDGDVDLVTVETTGPSRVIANR